MTAYAVAPATPEHCAYVAEHMRAADVAECWAGWRHTPAEAVTRSAAVSRDACYAGLADGVPLCVFGVGSATALSDLGSPWLLGTEDLPRHSRAFLRRNKAFVGHIRGEYSRLENYVDARNTLAIRWLKWLGFAVEEAAPFGAYQLPFHRFGWSACGLS